MGFDDSNKILFHNLLPKDGGPPAVVPGVPDLPPVAKHHRGELLRVPGRGKQEIIA